MDQMLVLFLWCAVLALLLRCAWGGEQPVAGMAICYWLNLAMVHFLPAVLTAIHGSSGEVEETSDYAFPLTAYAVVGFAAGVLIAARTLRRKLEKKRNPWPEKFAGGVGRARLAVGVGAAVFLLGNYADIPSMSSIAMAGSMLASGGMVWWWLVARGGGNRWAVVLSALTVTASILAVKGFLSYGVASALPLVAAITVYAHRRALLMAASVPLLYLSLSVCVTYLAGRTEMRHSTWDPDASLNNRVEVIEDQLSRRWRWFDFTDSRQQQVMDERFNQNYYLGRAAIRLDRHEMRYVHGGTYGTAAIAIIPRFIWRNKPPMTGGSELMSRFTGLSFSDGVSFGIGHIMEAYVNFGIAGIIITFIILGFVIGMFDFAAGRCLERRDFRLFMLYFVPAQCFLNGSVDSTTEIVAGAAGALVLTWLFLQITEMDGSGLGRSEHEMDVVSAEEGSRPISGDTSI